MRAIFNFLFRRKSVRREVRFVSYPEADRLIRESEGGWVISPEEDSNRIIGMVYIERLENRT